MSVEELLKDEAFKEALASVKSLEEAAGLFQEKGLDVTGEDLQAAITMSSSDELDETAMENVSGGIKLPGGIGRILTPLIPIIPLVPLKPLPIPTLPVKPTLLKK